MDDLETPVRSEVVEKAEENLDIPVRVELVEKTKMKPKRNIVSWISLVISILVFVFNSQPNWNPWNRNIEQKALAGNIDALMFVADVSFLAGNTEKSLSFYKLVTLYANMRNENDRLAASIAFNNRRENRQ